MPGAPLPIAVDRFAALEREIIAALSTARTNAAGVAARLEARVPLYKGKAYAPPSGRRRQTKEGAKAVTDALRYLKTAPSVEPLAEAADGLKLSAADHVFDVGGAGVASHVGSDGSSPAERNARYGAWTGACGECLWYGNVDGTTGDAIVDDLIVDDGVPSRGHRGCVFDERWRVCAAFIGGHAVYGQCVALEFAAGFEDDTGRAAARASIRPERAAASGAPAEAGPAKAGGTCWDLGTCRGCALPVKGGAVVEVKGAGKWHGACFLCSACGASLAGPARKKAEGRRVFCQACWVELYAPACAVCEQKIDGDRINCGSGTYRHASCERKKKAGLRKKATRVGPRALARAYAAAAPPREPEPPGRKARGPSRRVAPG